MAYAIGVARPVSLLVETFGTATVDPARIVRPLSTRSSTCARRPSSATSTCAGRSTARPPPTATSGGRDKEFSWEQTDQAGRLQLGAGACSPRGERRAPAGAPDRPPCPNPVRRSGASSPTWLASTRSSTTWCRTPWLPTSGSGPMVRVDLAGRRVGGWVVAVGRRAAARAGPAGPSAKVRGWGPEPAVVDLAAWAAWRWAGRRGPCSPPPRRDRGGGACPAPARRARRRPRPPAVVTGGAARRPAR